MINYHHIECYTKTRCEDLLREAAVYNQFYPHGLPSRPLPYQRFAVLIGNTLIIIGTKLKARYEAVNTATPEPIQGY
jgi:hypothetical protein